MKINNLKYPFYEEYFNIIDTFQKAYFFGFIMADGCLYQRQGHQDMISISIHQNDIEILETLKKELKTEKPIALIQDKRRPNTVMATLQITSNILSQALIEKGLKPNKSQQKIDWDKVLSNIPATFIPSFLLGYFDGDGNISIPKNNTISKSHVRISLPISTGLYFQNLLKTFNLNSHIEQDKRQYTIPFGSLTCVNTIEKYCFLKFIYHFPVVCLKRKQELAKQLMNRIECNITNRAENKNAIKQYKSVVLKWEELLET